MKIGIPIEADEGKQSTVCAHFGGAPAFLIVDTVQDSMRVLANAQDHDSHGQCVPVDLLRDEGLDGMIVAGIGRGALNRLGALGIRVYQAEPGSVEAALAALRAGSLVEFGADQACAGHAHGHSGH